VFAGHLPELIVLLVAALVIFGPKRLPEIGGAMGKGIREFRKGTQELSDKTAEKDIHIPDEPARIAPTQDHDPLHTSTQGHERDASAVVSPAGDPKQS
jgi:sec-independent protein translocase protein TatA